MEFEILMISQRPLLGMIGMPGPLELVIIALIFLLFFGKRLPDLMGSVGRSIVEFKKGAREIDGPESGEPDSVNHSQNS